MTKADAPRDGPVGGGSSGPGPSPPGSSHPSPRAAAREARTERLAAALKDNLRRRKAQAKEKARERDAATARQDRGPAPGGNNES